MPESRTLHDMLTETVNNYLLETGGGIPNGFVYAIQFIDGNGSVNNALGCMSGQSTLLSAGMVTYLDTASRRWVEEALFGDDD